MRSAGERPPLWAPQLSPFGAGRAALRHEGDRAAGGPGQRHRSVCPDRGAAGAGGCSVCVCVCGWVCVLVGVCGRSPPLVPPRGFGVGSLSCGSPGARLPWGACVWGVCGALCAALPGRRGLAVTLPSPPRAPLCWQQSRSHLAWLVLTASRSIPSWKGPTRILESRSQPCTGHPRESHRVPESVVLTLLGLWQARCCDTALAL